VPELNLDHTINSPVSDPVVGWRIVNLTFDLDNDGGSAIAQIGYYRASGNRDSVRDVYFVDESYDALILALATPAAGEDAMPTLASKYRFRVAQHIAGVILG
jgi:hypothetical protein